MQIVDQIPVPPVPPAPPDIGAHMPIFMSGDEIAKIVLFSLLGISLVVWIVARGPIGQAIGEVIRRRLGGGRAALPGESDAVMSRFDQMQHQIAELAERQDFAERLLAQVRREKALPPAGDVQG